MDRTTQDEGERRVEDQLIAPLLRLGLTKPVGMPKVQFEAMQAELRAKLAYMTPPNLAALLEKAEASPGGRDKDRFPIARVLLRWAADIQSPQVGPSPLMMSFWGHADGARVIEEGYAPEVQIHLRRVRVWPKPFALSQLRDQARPEILRREALETALADGEDLAPDDRAWLDRRIAAEAECRDIAAMGGAV
ncbi:hypothetical protein [Jannaschia sp. M317]|uniref:hypothetical protein n=1 Tax=Jannaschia sp. M317 TaxID=2867011 RepID=UPI0021A3FAD0|nr:hypothetical protein [Jannaschia sp. M317]UWQ16143.1 hypothetical protein K3551_09345 [Jannaschia sp. M317]